MRKYLTIAAYAIIVISCRKKDKYTPPEKPLQVEETTTTGAQPVVTVPANATLLPTKSTYNYIFDWETATTMPVFPGTPVVPLPWSDQAIRHYDQGLRNDYKKADGWELVYNTFSKDVNYANREFILYNKFRGLLRYYVYSELPSNTQVDSYRSFVNGINLNTGGEPSHQLNFAGQHIIDMDKKTSAASLLEPWPIAQGAWYISQYEIAYDEQMTSRTWNSAQMGWGMSFVRTEELLLNNTPVANKELFLQQEGTPFVANWGTRVSGNMQLQVKSVSGFDQLQSIFSGATINRLKSGATSNDAGNLFNATLVPSLNIADTKVDVPATFRLAPSGVGFVTMSFAIPGMDHSSVQGMGPVFNEPLGIFYLAAKPRVQHSTIAGTLPQQYTLDVPSVNYIINPFINAYADVRNFHQEIVAIDSASTESLTEAKIWHGTTLKASKPLQVLGVRVSLEVAPRNGSAPVKVIKTFKAL